VIAADVPQPRARDLYRARAYLATDATSRDSIGIRYSKGRFKGAYIRGAYPELGWPERRGHRGCVARARRNIPFRAGHTNRSRYYGRKRAALILTRPFGTCVSERDGDASRREQGRRGEGAPRAFGIQATPAVYEIFHVSRRPSEISDGTSYLLEESAGALSTRCREICPSRTPAVNGRRFARESRIERTPARESLLDATSREWICIIVRDPRCARSAYGVTKALSLALLCARSVP